MSELQALIVEDDPFITVGVEDVLSNAGYEVCGVAASEAEALRLGDATKTALAVVDVRLSPEDVLEDATLVAFHRFPFCLQYATWRLDWERPRLLARRSNPRPPYQR